MNDSIKFIKICPNDFSNASRDYRELEVCSELGMEIIVLAKGKESQKGVKEKINGFLVHRYTTRPLGTKIPKTINRVISVFVTAKYVRSLNADIISGHDIICLTIGRISNWFRRDKAKLVYDSHEYELGRNTKRNFLQRILIKKWEKYMIDKSELMIVVNDSIADEVKKVHRLKIRPLVIRNVPHKWNIDMRECIEVRKEITDAIGEGILFIYCGILCENRGIEEAIRILTYRDDYRLIILGNAGKKSYFDSLMKMADELGVRAKMVHRSAVPHDQMWKYLGASDIGIMLGKGTVKSYFFALPNKLFECIQANIPILASDLPEISKIVNKYDIGVICQPDNEKTVKEALNKLTLKSEWSAFKANTFIASEELCWENEKINLIKAYGKLMQS